MKKIVLGFQPYSKQRNTRPSNRGRHQQSHYDEKRAASIQKVTELYEKDGDDILLGLLNTRFGFEEYMNASSMSDELIELFLKLLCKSFRPHSLKSNQFKIVSSLVKSKYLSTLVYNHLNKTKFNGEYKLDFMRDTIELINFILVCNPSNRQYIQMIIERLENIIHLRVKDQDLIELFNKKINEVNALNQRKKSKKFDLNSLIEAPNKFTEISLIPSLEEILAEKTPFLRKNIIKGPFRDIEHYLDVHYRLLREDFLMPLRSGIHIIRNCVYERPNNWNEINRNLREIESIYISTNVKIVYGVFDNKNASYYIKLPISKAANIQWEKTKRFLYGSLIFLSNDYFVSNFVVAMITDCGNISLRNEGLLKIDINNLPLKHSNIIDSKSEYTMLETSALFESCKHVLNALCSLNQLSDEMFPFKKHLIDCDNDTIDPPEYLNGFRVDFSPLIGGKSSKKNLNVVSPKLSDASSTEQIDLDDSPLFDYEKSNFATQNEERSLESDEFVLDAQDTSRWPSAEQMNFDESQYNALKLALTKKITIIQGPPGTGKTFIGVKLLQLFLHNQHLWCNNANNNRTCPILMICYTNHALDQFLELCVKECKIRNGIVRVGGRSKSAYLDSFLLKNVKTAKRNDHSSREVNNVFYHIKDGYNNLSRIEKIIKSQLDIINNCYKKLPGLLAVHRFMDEEYNDDISTDLQLLVWLGFDKNEAFIQKICNNLDDARVKVRDDIDEEALNVDLNDIDEDNQDRMVDNDDVVIAVHEQQRKSLVADKNDCSSKEFINEADIQKFEDYEPVDKNNNTRNTIRSCYYHKILNNLDDNKYIFTDMIWNLKHTDRVRLYRNWIIRLIKHSQETIEKCKHEYNQAFNDFNELKLQEDRFILQNSKIIAMTTTGSARYHSILRDIGPKIVIVEEAAEVFEAHVVASLSEKCEHLILIGDHVQLRPKPNVYTLEKDYHLDVSLFERLIKNGVPSVQLNTQHRMRPELSVLMRHFYDKPIIDNQNVFSYPNIIGVTHNVAFVHHEHEELSMQEGQSKVNLFEVDYLVAFARFLLKQQYQPSQITILTTYLGQFYQFRDALRKSDMSEVKCTTVDNYQGEENDIILLSLVRSNFDNNMGFLKIKNRICVALSRAKWGFYCVGNFKTLSTNELWRNIRQSFANYNEIVLSCGSHPENNLVAKTSLDIDSRLEGGCAEACTYRLNCGHVCPLSCHLYGKEHVLIECKVICKKPLKCGHTCQDYCSHRGACNERKCKVAILKTLDCGHDLELPCNSDIRKVHCQVPCEKILDCGHKCLKECGESCDPCKTKVLKKSLCEHSKELKVFCHTKEWELQAMCNELCGFRLDCDHLCSGTCGKCFGGRIHTPCAEKCERILICGHVCNRRCANDCRSCAKRCENQCVHSKCERKCGSICTPCKMKCVWSCEHKKCTKLCHELCDREACDKPCKKLLKCKHACVGFCGEPCPKLCRICNASELSEIFFGAEDEPNARFIQLEDCGHVFESCGLEEWLKSIVDSQNNETTQSVAITLPCCPRCKTPIRKNLRFSNYVKRQLFVIEKVKEKFNGSFGEIESDKDKLKIELCKYVFRGSDDLIKKLELKLEPKDLSSQDITDLRNKLTMLKSISNLLRKFKSLLAPLDKYDLKKMIDYEVKKFKLCLSDSNISNQQLEDLSSEIQRLSKIHEFLSLESKLCIQSDNQKQDEIDGLKSLLLTLLISVAKNFKFLIEDVNDALSKLVPFTSGLVISDEERLDILKAMNLTKGHWYKCPNGHVYCITECGGAMQESKCPDCGEKIGGTSHKLVSTNTVASEMDGSEHGAWSEQANLEEIADYEDF